MSAGRDAYNRSRYEQARKDLRAEVESEIRKEFETTAPAKLIELAERFVVAVEAIAQRKRLPIDIVKAGAKAFEEGLAAGEKNTAYKKD